MNIQQLRERCIDDFHHDSMETRFNQFLDAAETRLNQDITARQIERSLDGTVAVPYIELPEDFNVAKRLIVVDGGREYTLDFQSQLAVEHRTNFLGRPRTFAIQDQVIQLYPGPDKTYEFQFYYVPVVQRMTQPNETNWILTSHDGIYRYGVMTEAAIGLKDWDSQDRYMALYMDALAAYQSMTDRARFPLDTPMKIRMRPTTQGRNRL